ncbi:MAG: thioester domain-containing protein [Clostridiales bacterium]|nr:thioester domain-containing protein [Clostridiales bacterium]
MTSYNSRDEARQTQGANLSTEKKSIRHKPKRLTALALALTILLGCFGAIPAGALSVGDSSTISVNYLTQFGQYNITSPVIKYGELPMITLRSDGTPIYCIDMETSISGTGINAKSIEDTAQWQSLSDFAKDGITYCLLYGYPNNNFGVSDEAAYAATQCLISEYQTGARTSHSQSSSMWGTYITRNSGINTAYNALKEAIVNHASVPSFVTNSTIELMGIGSSYAQTLTDTNGVLSG